MNAWILLAFAIVIEVIGTNSIKYSDGFTKPLPTVAVLICFFTSLYLLSLITKALPVGIVYAVWAGCGIVLTAVVAYFLFGQKPDLAGFIGMAMILGGVMVINLFSDTSA